jgi:hypothetical protein
MTVESATYISSLDSSLPGVNDNQAIEGAAHIKLIKSTVKATFPNVTGPVTADQTELNMLDGATGTVKTTTTAGEWVLLHSTSMSSTPTTIDLVHGTGGVDFSTSYDCYMLELQEIFQSAGADLQMQMSVNAGVTFPANATGGRAQISRVSNGTAADSEVATVNYFPISSLFTGTTAATALTARVTFTRSAIGTTYNSLLFSEYVNGSGALAGTIKGVMNNSSAQFNAIRLLWSGAGTFGNHGRYRLWGRRA